MLVFFLYPCVCVFFIMLVLSVFICFSASNWMVAWVGMEFNMLCFLPLVVLTGRGGERVSKYFIAQARGSTIFLLSPVMWSMVDGIRIMFFFVVGLLLKLGSSLC